MQIHCVDIVVNVKFSRRSWRLLLCVFLVVGGFCVARASVGVAFSALCAVDSIIRTGCCCALLARVCAFLRVTALTMRLFITWCVRLSITSAKRSLMWRAVHVRQVLRTYARVVDPVRRGTFKVSSFGVRPQGLQIIV